ncbi:glycosyltransferase [Pseudomonas piscis]|uniref:glycosyltransferase n=1 Tax=Pseudomonas piscis TaxID=2614538 RepID=UPI0039A75940
MSEKPLVSVVIPAYKAEYFEVALASACAQSYECLEVVICDDSRTDIIRECTARYQQLSSVAIRYEFNDQQRGELFNAIECIKIARGKYIKFLHDDDVLHPECVAELVAAMEADPSISIASSRRRLIDSAGQVLPDALATSLPFATDVVIDGRELTSLLADHSLNFIGEPSCVLCRREDLLALGDDLMSLNGCLIYWVGDLAMYVKLLQKGDLAMLKAPLADFRVSLDQGSQQGRDKPGIGNQGHADFKRTLRELGWHLGRPDNQLVGVRALHGAAGFEKLDILAALRQSHAKGISDRQIANWIGQRVPSSAQLHLIDQYLRSGAGSPSIGIVVLDRLGDPDALGRTLRSLSVQDRAVRLQVLVIAPSLLDLAAHDMVLQFSVLESDYAGQINRLLEEVNCEWCLLVEAGDEFTPGGLMIASLELLPNPDCRAVFCDGVQSDGKGEAGVMLRPDFNLDYLLSCPGIMARHWIFRRQALIRAGGFDGRYGQALEFELILRMINQEGADGFGHIPELLLSCAPVRLHDNADERRALVEHLAQRGYAGAHIEASLPGHYLIDYGHQPRPLVSILVLADDDLAALQRCIFSILEHSRYPSYELLIVDNACQSPEARQWLQSIGEMAAERVRVFHLPYRVDRSTANNLVAQQACGDYLLFLDAQAAIFEGGWIDALLNHALRQEVAVVGAKMLSGEGEVTHAGLILGLPGAGVSAFAQQGADAPGYMGSLVVDRDCSAVSSACMMVRKALFDGVGGLDAGQFPGAGADIDLCLRLAGHGYLTVWTPRAMVMREGAAEVLTARDEDALAQRWLSVLARDPAYNLNFSLGQPKGFQLAEPSLCWRPLVWRPLPVVLVHPSDRYASGHYRAIQPMEGQNAAGLIDGVVSMALLSAPELERITPDSIIFQRHVGEESLNAMRRARDFSRSFKVFELNDHLPSLVLGEAGRGMTPEDVARYLRQALGCVDRLVVSTDRLAETMHGMHPDIRVIQSRLDPLAWGDALPASRRRSGEKPRVGWAGGEWQSANLEVIGEVVQALAAEVDWVFMGACPQTLRPYVKEVHRGAEISLYPAALARLNLDLAVAPLQQTLLNECKSSLRLLEYGACGFPVVCSDLPGFRNELPVTRVPNRFDSWIEAIRMHLADPQANARAGDVLREAVRRDWLLDRDGLVAWRNIWLPD